MAGPAQMPEAYPHGLKTLTPGNTIVEALQILGPGFRLVPLDGNSPYVKPKAALYDFNGKERRWDVVESHASVGVVLYHRDLDAFVIVRQFRPAVYASLLREAEAAGRHPPPFKDAFTYELCAGLIDKSKSNVEICQEEILEECGFSVPLEAIREVGVGISSAGTQGSPHIMYYAEVAALQERLLVDSSMAVEGAGGGLLGHGECIEVLALPLDLSQDFVMDGKLPKSPGLMFGLTWAYFNKLNGNLGPRGNGPANGNCANPLLTEELVLKPVLPA
ncbi:hypothetical protein VOLCADRAFT_119828 [Volvox carteri f. nagariensis]|uniref:Nudix hydrolase domain-containing protein n=1 Tax=Volvox carteri f. nagariensis TaxID=3068 RepID=D8UHA0_VOLCA|nr:uncharacterized protein VOLCADRAFT_119828 [Volvox carteri f. nagariensis]EFJ40866.1 hypothetical protein VOLCADRAFT_119828 [Volvox carteri f. nagariensis]|eukprot:XP_002958026.1 hypothetical protein VOLCADRAFT_119828 [Volvox carteri f. nagariensis]